MKVSSNVFKYFPQNLRRGALKYRWIGRNVDIDQLVEAIIVFLKGKKFKIRRDDLESSSRVLGIHRTPEGEIRRVAVTISGSPQDLIVELKVGDDPSLLLKFSSMISLFGGGLLLVKKRKIADFYQKLEDEFWRYVERRI